MNQPLRRCDMCQSTDVHIIHEQKTRAVLQCDRCCFAWTNYQPWRELPLTPQQHNWLAVRGLDCDGTRGHAADMIGDRDDWRKRCPTDAQFAWFSRHELMMPATRGDCAEMMADWRKRMEERA